MPIILNTSLTLFYLYCWQVCIFCWKNALWNLGYVGHGGLDVSWSLWQLDGMQLKTHHGMILLGYYHSGRKIINKPDLLYDEACYGFVNFPLFAYLFVPLGRLPKELAGALFFLIGYVSILPLAYWLVKFSDLQGWMRYLFLVFLAVNGPLDYSIWLGNVTHIVMLILLIVLWLFKQGRHWLSGILLGRYRINYEFR